MLPPLHLLYSGIGILAALTLVSVIASALTLVFSWGLLRYYRRAVEKSMAARTTPQGRPAGDTAEQPSSTGAEVEPKLRHLPFQPSSQSDTREQFYRRALYSPWRHAFKYAIAGLFYAAILAVGSYYAFSQLLINPLAAAKHPAQWLFWFWTFCWPVVLTTEFVAATARKSRYLLPAGYCAVLVLLSLYAAWIPTESPLSSGNVTMLAWSGETPLRLLAKWNLYNFAPTLLTVGFRNRRVRAVAPLVLSFMTIVTFGLVGVYFGAFYYLEASVRIIALLMGQLGVHAHWAVAGYFTLLASLTCVAFALPGWWVMKGIRAGYERKVISDQSLALDSLWLVFAVFYAAILFFAGIGWGLWAVAAYIAFKLALRLAYWLVPEKTQYGKALLILRVFSLGKRSEALFDVVSRHWRYIGNVQLIAGPDLAISTVAPHRFLAFLSGKLGHLFVNDALSMEHHMQALDAKPDRDGRFRINDFFCRADTWQNVLKRLVAGSDAVLMDLRSFSQDNDGCLYEIKELLQRVPLSRIVFVIDESTKHDFLRRTLADCCAALPSESPNFGASASDVQTSNLKSLECGEVENLLRRLCSAAA